MKLKAPIVAVANHKGGVGKTTITVNLALLLAAEKKRVLIVDADPQAHSTSYIVGPPGEEDYPRSLGPLLEKIADEGRISKEETLSILATTPNPEISRLWLLPSHLKIARLEGKLLGSSVARMFGFKRIIAQILEEEDYDVVFIDCPPNLGVLTEMSLIAADYLLIPMEPSFPSVTAVGDILLHVEELEEGLMVEGLAPSVLGIVLNRFKARTTNDQMVKERVEKMAEARGVKVFKTVIPDSVKMREVFQRGVSIETHSPNSPIAEAFQKLKEEFWTTLTEMERARRPQPSLSLEE